MTRPPVPPRSPSVQSHRRQFVWQVLLPVLLVAVLALAFLGWTIAGGTGQNRLWADVAVIWMILPAMLFGLVMLALTVVMIWLMARARRGLPNLTGRVQQFSRNLRAQAERIADAFAAPVLFIEGLLAAFNRFIRRD